MRGASWSRLQPTADLSMSLLFCLSYHDVLNHKPTRRLQSGQIDYFILDPPDFPVQQHDLLRLVEWTTCLRLTDEQIERVLDHDPLVCKIGMYYRKL